jgi:hypothetical protein
MIRSMTSRYHDWGILALGFSAAALIELAMGTFVSPSGNVHHAATSHLLWGVAVGPLIVICLLLKSTVPHRIVLVAGAGALVMFILGLR